MQFESDLGDPEIRADDAGQLFGEKWRALQRTRRCHDHELLRRTRRRR
jgi:hypothetical protein